MGVGVASMMTINGVGEMGSTVGGRDSVGVAVGAMSVEVGSTVDTVVGAAVTSRVALGDTSTVGAVVGAAVDSTTAVGAVVASVVGSGVASTVASSVG